jgi:hypothetical protein
MTRIKPWEAKALKGRMRKFKYFVDSTSHYSHFNTFEPILQYQPSDKEEDFKVQVGVNGKLCMTREEFDKYGSLTPTDYKFINLYFPTETVFERTERFLKKRMESYRLRHKEYLKQRAS